MMGRKGPTPAALALLGVGLLAPPLASQAVVTGTVREDSTGRPLAGAEVLIEALGRRTLTDSRGRYVLGDLSAGTRLVLVRSVGYHPVGVMVRLAAGDTARADVMLERTVVQLAPIEVRGAPPRAPRGLGPEAFEERRRMGFGDSLTPRCCAATGISVWPTCYAGTTALTSSCFRVECPPR